jgi:hypothetical protein
MKQSDKGPEPIARPAQQLVSGAPVPEDDSHTRLKANGQQQDYVVLNPEERARGFVRPVRQSYVHVGPVGPQGSFSRRLPVWGSSWTIPVGTCAIVGVIP